jgi:prepilin-type N-terminal cleavage/methylation domain-containing protein
MQAPIEARTTFGRSPGLTMTYRTAFTLVELLVVVAIIGVLVALLLPAVQAAREASRRTHCANNLRQLGVAAQLYHDAQQHFPGSWVNGDENVTWGLHLMPHLEQAAFYDAWDQSVQWWVGRNVPLVATPIPLYKCPSADSPATYEYSEAGKPPVYGTSDYKGCDGVYPFDQVVKHWQRKEWILGVVSHEYIAANHITDGLSSTLLLVESVGGKDIYNTTGVLNIPKEIWFPGDGAWVGRALSAANPTKWNSIAQEILHCGVNCTNAYDYGPYSHHPSLAQSALCDGAVRTLDESIDDLIYCALYSYQDGEPVGDY